MTSAAVLAFRSLCGLRLPLGWRGVNRGVARGVSDDAPERRVSAPLRSLLACSAARAALRSAGTVCSRCCEPSRCCRSATERDRSMMLGRDVSTGVDAETFAQEEGAEHAASLQKCERAMSGAVDGVVLRWRGSAQATKHPPGRSHLRHAAVVTKPPCTHAEAAT